MPRLRKPLTPLAAALRAGRETRNLTREEMAGLLGVTVQTIGAWESGATEPSGPFLLAYCRACEIDPRELVA